MTARHHHSRTRFSCGGFNAKELLVVIVITGVLIMLLLPSLNQAKRRSQRVTCAGRLGMVTLGFQQWAIGHAGDYPMSLATNLGGTKEWIATGQTFRHFEVMSNELNTPRVLGCPSDRTRLPADSFDPKLSNSNISYFVGTEARGELPQMILTGDRNVWSGARPPEGVVALASNAWAGWGPDLHAGQGNIALADGSVQGVSSSRLREALANTGVQTNWIQLP